MIKSKEIEIEELNDKSIENNSILSDFNEL